MSRFTFIFFLVLIAVGTNAQTAETLAKTNSHKSAGTTEKENIVIVTGARFSYKLVQRWIDEYTSVNPDVQIIIDARGSSDPAKYDVLAEVYDVEPAEKQNRAYVNIGRYAILPVASSKAAITTAFSKKGINRELLQQLFFHNIFADKDKQEKIKVPFTAYTRLQKAGVPIVFSRHFGFEQKDLSGRGIAGSDEHLLKALLRDSTGISYLPLSLIYDPATRKPIDGLSVLPLDFDDNGKLSDEERSTDDLDALISYLEGAAPKALKNVPVSYLHLSVDKKTASPEAVAFLKWVNENGLQYLKEYGYLQPEPGKYDKAAFEQFASKR